MENVNATRLTHLRVKVASLAAEARIIRRLENTARRRMIAAGLSSFIATRTATYDTERATWLSLQSHRRYEVRQESRCAHLAYGYLRGTPYRVMEAKCHEAPAWGRVRDLAVRFSGLPKNFVSADALKAWYESQPAAQQLAA